ncbi:uncharacterized protein PRCAT00005267001 [Priceomyces carsonii]|uniref:uncharacterized protein n=1 Tax=Priceomyces carsonii TaxID=28549 RepID=UPI002ED7DDF8|nr:unnamed protein product [Priceomyces carsonii]
MPSEKEIIIIGGSYAAIHAFKTLCGKKDTSLNITLISLSVHAFFNIATPRLIIEPEKTSQAVFLLEDTLRKHANGIKFKFIKGHVISTVFKSQNIEVEVEGQIKDLKYDYLIIATGTRSDQKWMKVNENSDESINELKKLSEDVRAAESIAVVGAGPTGVEIAGELGFNFGKDKKITIYTGASGPLSLLGSKSSTTVTNLLKLANVCIVNNLKVDETHKVGNLQKLSLSDGSTKEFDLVVPTTGLKPNSDFIEDEYLDDNGYLVTDKTFRVKEHPEVIGLGDILALSNNTLVSFEYYQKQVFKPTIENVIFGVKNSRLKEFNTPATTILVPVTKNRGLLLIYGWSFPSIIANFVVRVAKGKDYMLLQAALYLA